MARWPRRGTAPHSSSCGKVEPSHGQPMMRWVGVRYGTGARLDGLFVHRDREHMPRGASVHNFSLSFAHVSIVLVWHCLRIGWNFSPAVD